MELVLAKLTEKIIAAAIQSHKALGPGFLEYVYERALCIEFRQGESTALILPLQIGSLSSKSRR